MASWRTSSIQRRSTFLSRCLPSAVVMDALAAASGNRTLDVVGRGLWWSATGRGWWPVVSGMAASLGGPGGRAARPSADAAPRARQRQHPRRRTGRDRLALGAPGQLGDRGLGLFASAAAVVTRRSAGARLLGRRRGEGVASERSPGSGRQPAALPQWRATRAPPGCGAGRSRGSCGTRVKRSVGTRPRSRRCSPAPTLSVASRPGSGAAAP
jgi:hypothetical protein